MVRLLAILVGLFFAGMLGYSGIRTTVGMFTEPAVPTAEELFHKHPRNAGIAGTGMSLKFDRSQLQRGFQVYKEVCSSCHGINLVAFRDLEGIGYSEGQIKTIASEWAIETPTLNPETGEVATRKSTAADKFPAPYANEVAAKAANNGVAPPDLSLMTKARHDGPNYVYSLLTGYQAPSAALAKQFPDSVPKKGPNGEPSALHHNPYFHSLNIGMPAPLHTEGQVSYDAGNTVKPTVDQMSKDVAAFLTWTAEPKMEIRKQAGLATLFFVLIFTWLAWLSYKTIWARVKR